MSNKPGFFRQLKDTQNYSTKFLIVLFSPNSGVTPYNKVHPPHKMNSYMSMYFVYTLYYQNSSTCQENIRFYYKLLYIQKLES